MLRTSIAQGVRRFVSTQIEMKCNRLEGKVAIVTASTEGIGFAIARRLAQEGAKVMISSRKQANVDKALNALKSEGLDVSGLICHVSKSEDRKNLFNKTIESYGGLDILVSNAAVSPDVGAVLDCPEKIWDKVFDVNVKSTFLLMQESLPFLRKSKSASIIMISSIAGYMPSDFLGVYSVSKTALLGLCKCAALQLATEGIRVNCISPGVIKTKFSAPFYSVEAAETQSLSVIPMRRFGEPDEISGIAAFLASSDASYITGESIVAAGGTHSRL